MDPSTLLFSANVGTPLMWAGMFHLAIGNFLIAAGEGWLVSRFFHLPYARCFGLFLAANYASALVGVGIVGGALAPWAEHGLFGLPPLYVVPWLLLAAVIVFWTLTVLIEGPFCFFMVTPKERSWKKALKMSLVAQTASYALLVPFYLSASYFGIYTKAHLRTDLEFVKPPSRWVYFIGLEDGDLWRIQTNGKEKERVGDANLNDPWVSLVSCVNDGGDSWGIWSVPDNRSSSPTLIYSASLGQEKRSKRPNPQTLHPPDRYRSPYGRPVDLRPKEKRDIMVRVGSWAADGIHIWGRASSHEVSLETPFLQWYSRNATILPTNQMVYQLNNQILILDLDTLNLGFLTMGRGPVVGFDAAP